MAFWKREKAHISKADKQDCFLILAKKGVKCKPLQVRFTLVKFGMWKEEKDNSHPFDIPLLY